MISTAAPAAYLRSIYGTVIVIVLVLVKLVELACTCMLNFAAGGGGGGRLGVCFSTHERQAALVAWNAVALLPTLKRAGIVKRVSYHTFRRMFGTLLNANGENPKVVQELLRHASLKVTTDVYTCRPSGLRSARLKAIWVKLVRKGFDSGVKSS